MGTQLKTYIHLFRYRFGDEVRNTRGQFWGGLVTRNGRIIADSAEGYSSKGAAEDAIDRIRKRAPEADHLDITPAGF